MDRAGPNSAQWLVIWFVVLASLYLYLFDLVEAFGGFNSDGSWRFPFVLGLNKDRVIVAIVVAGATLCWHLAYARPSKLGVLRAVSMASLVLCGYYLLAEKSQRIEREKASRLLRIDSIGSMERDDLDRLLDEMKARPSASSASPAKPGLLPPPPVTPIRKP